jgi:hypothetical protein
VRTPPNATLREVREFDPKRSTARDDAPNVDK